MCFSSRHTERALERGNTPSCEFIRYYKYITHKLAAQCSVYIIFNIAPGVDLINTRSDKRQINTVTASLFLILLVLVP